MLRRVSSNSIQRAFLPTVAVTACRQYQLIPHTEWEVEELAEAANSKRWRVDARLNYGQTPETQAELMCEKLNRREGRRRGAIPEKSIIRNFSQQFAIDGKPYYPPAGYEAKQMQFTVIDFNGMPFHFRTHVMPDVTLNQLMDGSGMMMGEKFQWSACQNVGCTDKLHGEGCLINIDLETLDRLSPPSLSEYEQLNQHMMMGRPDVQYTTRHSCQIYLTEELDGGLFAVRQYHAPSYKAVTADWGHFEDLGVISYHACRKVEPWAPMLEEPTVQDFPVTFDMLWEDDWQEILRNKYPRYRRKDGAHTKPTNWAGMK